MNKLFSSLTGSSKLRVSWCKHVPLTFLEYRLGFLWVSSPRLQRNEKEKKKNSFSRKHRGSGSPSLLEWNRCHTVSRSFHLEDLVSLLCCFEKNWCFWLKRTKVSPSVLHTGKTYRTVSFGTIIFLRLLFEVELPCAAAVCFLCLSHERSTCFDPCGSFLALSFTASQFRKKTEFPVLQCQINSPTFATWQAVELCVASLRNRRCCLLLGRSPQSWLAATFWVSKRVQEHVVAPCADL